MLKLKLSVLLLVLSLLTGCASLASVLPVLDSAVTDSTLVLKTVETAFEAFQLSTPVPTDVRAEYNLLLANAYQDLQKGAQIVADLHDIDQGKYDAAFADFKKDYALLTAFLKAHGVSPIGKGIGAAQTPGEFPVPRVIGLRVRS